MSRHGNGLLRALALLQCLGIGAGCGGSSSGSSSSSGPVPNTLPVTINGGSIPNENNFNTLYASVTICVPGSSSQCQTISDIQVDTGSSGLRIVASALGLSIPQAKGPGGGNLAECQQFSNSSTWGSVRTVDVRLAGEVASSLAIQVIGDPALPTIPVACTNGGFPASNDAASLGANGILGVGNFIQDCGPACEVSGPSNAGFYYECTSGSGCTVAAVPGSQQVQNPVALFASDNNGVVITLPPVNGESPTLNGTLFFGIGTQNDNRMASATVLTYDNSGFLGTQFQGNSLPFSFIDSGSSGLAFPDLSIQTCADLQNMFFCPPAPVSLSGVITGANGTSSSPVPFAVENADTVFNQFPNDSAFATVCSPALVTNASAANGPNSFDWGLPFFFGRTVFTALEQRSTPAGPGPYVAF